MKATACGLQHHRSLNPGCANQPVQQQVHLVPCCIINAPGPWGHSRHIQCQGAWLHNSSLQRRLKPVTCQASKGDSSDKDDKAKKADFSAYWSMKVSEFFSNRKAYLEGGDKIDKRPELLKQLNQAVIDQENQLQAAAEAAMEAGVTPEAAEKEAREITSKALRPLDQALLGKPLPPLPPPSPGELVAQDAREQLAPPGVPGALIPLYRAQEMLQAIVMAPFTLLAAAYTAWRSMFKSHRYEMFLMSEGERMWYWRNRTENERWFWEIFAWDRLLFPALCTIAYEYVAPANLIWTLVVPLMFIMWQNGSMPGIFNMEFWLIMYFGVYKKCWADVLALLSAVFVWA